MVLKDWKKIRNGVYRHKKNKTSWVYVEKDAFRGGYVLSTDKGYENSSDKKYLMKEALEYMRSH